MKPWIAFLVLLLAAAAAQAQNCTGGAPLGYSYPPNYLNGSFQLNGGFSNGFNQQQYAPPMQYTPLQYQPTQQYLPPQYAPPQYQQAFVPQYRPEVAVTVVPAPYLQTVPAVVPVPIYERPFVPYYREPAVQVRANVGRVRAGVSVGGGYGYGYYCPPGG
jgi:hypothetical protein